MTHRVHAITVMDGVPVAINFDLLSIVSFLRYY